MKAKFIYESIERTLLPKTKEQVIKDLSLLSQDDRNRAFILSFSFDGEGC